MIGALVAVVGLVVWCLVRGGTRAHPHRPHEEPVEDRLPGADPAHGSRILHRAPSAVRFVRGADDTDIALHVLGRVVEVES